MTKPAPAFSPDEPRFSHSDGLTRKRVFVGGKVGTVETTAVAAPDVLERLHSRSTIHDRQHAAAIAWATDYERSGLSVAVCASYGGSVAASNEPEPERRRAAKERFRRGYASMTPDEASVVWAVVIDNVTLAAWARGRRVDPRKATTLFCDGLDTLAKFYGA